MPAPRQISASDVAPFVSRSVPSPSYRFFIPGRQFPGSGNAKDVSGKGADAIITTAYTDAQTWANRNYITTVNSNGKGLYVPAASAAFDLATQSIIFHAVMNAAIPAVGNAIFGNADTSANRGIFLSLRNSTGKLRPIVNASGGLVAGLADSNAVFADSTDHHAIMAVDGPTRSIFLYADGFLSNSYPAAFSGNTAGGTNFGLGLVASATPASAPSFDLKTNGIGLLVFNGSLPSNLGYLATRLASVPLLPLSDSELVF